METNLDLVAALLSYRSFCIYSSLDALSNGIVYVCSEFYYFLFVFQ